jgi:site-specific recombinase XerD
MPDASDVDDTEPKDRAIVLWTESSFGPRAPSPSSTVARGAEVEALACQPKPFGEGLVAWLGERAAFRTLEFLTAGIGNTHTRRAYTRAAKRFLAWCNARGLRLDAVRSPDVAAYIQELGRSLAPLSVKQHLAALKHWFDWLVTGHALDANPAHAVRGPRYSQNTGKTPIVDRGEAKALLDSIEASSVVGSRDKALIATLLFSWARIGALVAMTVRDYRGAGTPRATLLLHEKNGKDHIVPVHHAAAEFLDAYIAMAGIAESPDAPLWQNAPGHAGKLSGAALSQRGALDVVKRRCRAARLPDDICNHSFRATGMTLYLEAEGSDLESARQLAGHANIKTTQLYNRSGDRKKKAEVERVQL